MTEAIFNEKLNQFKQNEKPEAVLIIADNPELIRISVAWTNIQVKQKEKRNSPSLKFDSEAFSTYN
jgi:hypothetical protein